MFIFYKYLFTERDTGLKNHHHRFQALIILLISLHCGVTGRQHCLITLSWFNLFCLRLLRPHQQFHRTKNEL